jgi:hypothetical protein
MNINVDSDMRSESRRVNSSKQGNAFLKEFKDFTVFLRNLWGILAGISVLFPLSNVLMQIIPLETLDHDGALVWFSARLFTTVATIVSLFLILWTFGQRHHFQSARKTIRIQKQAWISFGVGLAALITYLSTYYFIATSAYDVLGWESADARRLLGEVFLLLVYSTFFALLTRAFVLLGMIEFFRQEKKIP